MNDTNRKKTSRKKILDLSKSNIEYLKPSDLKQFKNLKKIIFSENFKSLTKDYLKSCDPLKKNFFVDFNDLDPDYLSNLKELDFSKVKNLEEFPEDFFQVLPSLEKIILPENAKIKINANIFDPDTKIDYMYIVEHSSEISSRAFDPEIIKELIKKGMNVKFDKSMMIDTSIPKEKVIEILQNSEISYGKNFLLFEDLDKFNIEDLKYIIDNLPKGKNINLVLNRHNQNDKKLVSESSTPYLYTQEEFAKLTQINEYLKEKTGKELLYQEFYTDNKTIIDENCWSHSKVETANRKIDDIVDIIKNNKMTQLEAMIYIHKQATSFVYNSEDSEQLPEASRTIVGLYPEEGFPNIVCVGYASFVKAAIDKLNMPGLKCSLNSCRLINYDNPKLFNGHANNIIEIVDPNYNVDGTFIEDSCFSSPKLEKKETNLNNEKSEKIEEFTPSNKKDLNYPNFSTFLYPVRDINNLILTKQIFLPDTIMKNYLYGEDFYSNLDKNSLLNVLNFRQNIRCYKKIQTYSKILFLIEKGIDIELIPEILNSTKTKQSAYKKEITKNEIQKLFRNLENETIQNKAAFLKEKFYNELLKSTSISENISQTIFNKGKLSYRDSKNEYNKSKKIESKFDNINQPLTFDNFCNAYKNCLTKTGEFDENKFNKEIETSIYRSLSKFTLNSESIFIKQFLNNPEKNLNSNVYLQWIELDEKKDIEQAIKNYSEKQIPKSKNIETYAHTKKHFNSVNNSNTKFTLKKGVILKKTTIKNKATKKTKEETYNAKDF